MAGCADPAGLPKLAETQVLGGSFDALAGLRFPEAVGERFQAWHFPVEAQKLAQKWRFRWWIRKVVSTWTDGGRRSLSGCHFPARHAAVKLEFEGHFPGTTFRSPCYDEDRKVFNEMAHFPTRDFPAKKLQEGLPERGFNSLSGCHFPPGIQY